MNQELLLQQFRLNKSFSKAQKIFIRREGVFMREGVYYALRNSFYGKKTTEKQFSTKISGLRVKYIKGLGFKNIDVQEKRIKKLAKAEKEYKDKRIGGEKTISDKLRTYFRYGFFARTEQEYKKHDYPSHSSRNCDVMDGLHSKRRMEKLTGLIDFKKEQKIKGNKIAYDKSSYRYLVYEIMPNGDKKTVKETVMSEGIIISDN